MNHHCFLLTKTAATLLLAAVLLLPISCTEKDRRCGKVVAKQHLPYTRSVQQGEILHCKVGDDYSDTWTLVIQNKNRLHRLNVSKTHFDQYQVGDKILFLPPH